MLFYNVRFSEKAERLRLLHATIKCAVHVLYSTCARVGTVEVSMGGRVAHCMAVRTKPLR